MTDAPLELGPQSDGTRVELQCGAEFTLALPENPTTGYRWTVAECGAVLALAASSFDAPPPGPAGAGGLRRLRLTAVQPGRTRLRLLLKQPWLDDASADRSFKIDVTVQP